MEPVFTAGQALEHIERSFANPKALNDFRNNTWRSLSTDEFVREVKRTALALIEHGVKKGDMVGILAVPSVRWTVVDFAVMSIGAVTVPLFAIISDENFEFEIKQTGLKVVFIDGQEPIARYRKNKNLFSLAVHMGDSPLADALSYVDFLKTGLRYEVDHPGHYEKMRDAVTPDDLATIIYSSGSTGIPKGVEHTHRGLFSLIHCDIFNWDSVHDAYLSVLPLAHVFARTLNIITVTWGISVYYFNDLKNIGTACKTIHPTILVVVPRLLEKVYAKMVDKVQHAGLLKGAIGSWAFDLAHLGPESTYKQLFHTVAEKLVYSHLREALGGRLRIVISGGAALDPQLNHFFCDIGVPILEGWGLTEACPFTVNRIGKAKIGTIGTPIGPLEIKISSEGEILARGPIVMRGYYKNRVATAAALDKEGWLHTGDKGSIDEEGYVKIIGRLREILKTSTGEMIAPVPIEHALCKAPFIETAVVIADKKKFAACLLVPDFEILKTIQRKQGCENMSTEEFLNSDYIRQETEKLIGRLNEHLNQWEKIQAFRFIPRPLSIEQGELTPSMKVVREVVSRNYKSLIDSMYPGESP